MHAPMIAPGDRWTGERGEDRWRLSTSPQTLTRLSDDVPLTEIVGVDAALPLVIAFLAIRPGGGRVWVDGEGNATTQIDGHDVYLGTLTAAAALAHVDDGTLRGAIIRALTSTPHSTVREIAFQLTRDGQPTGRSEVNQVLYGERSVFTKDDSTVPRWQVASGPTDSSAPSPQPARSPRSRREVQDRDTYAHLLEPEPSATPVRAPAVARAAQQAPVHVLDLMSWQHEAIAAWYASGCHGIIEAVTGTGKTHVGLEAVAHAAARGERSTVLVPSVDLQDQWTARFASFLPDLRVAWLGGRSSGNPESADVTIAVVNSATKTDLSAIPRASLIVADEVHRYGAEGFQVALRVGYERRLGLTATLERTDDAIEAVLNPYFGGTRLVVGFDRAIREKVVAPFRLVMAPVTMNDEEQAEYDDLSQKISTAIRALRSQGALGGGGGGLLQQIGRLCGAPGRVGHAARTATGSMRDRRRMLALLSGKLDAIEELSEVVAASQGAVLFTQSKEVAEEATIRLREWGVAASALHSGMSAAERGAALRGLTSGDLQALAAPKLLDEGIDLPSVDLGIVMTASRSRRQMVQRLGRVIRRKADGRPVDFLILYAAGTVEDPSDEGVHEGFFDLVGEVATHRLELEPGWTAAQL
ncbi:Superfamily II DNA or RNA helicase [Sanguibacter gelidistatuariae]|uniref:Superfamily II DNA or RNA helicase n=1 Tax=Sanguibacter gelidistatuariae TaxID=1814289 RepID=A0A1G6XP84_9MICO|nr:DEAD/DEAH box helicase [Sanguibacter gelidistatuariae]SDD80029.1 Superfamily II DNA or RNA helicase [Sanguibacter gelidistatuariae]